MTKLVRVTLLNGETRAQKLPEGMALPQWWKMVQADGAVLGEVWCARFEAISHADVVGDAGSEQSRAHANQERATSDLAGIAASIAAGAWKSPYEA